LFKEIVGKTRANGDSVREFSSLVRFVTANRSAWSALRGGSNLSRLLGFKSQQPVSGCVCYLHAVNGGVGWYRAVLLFAGSLSGT
jgi:hypothetical protein